MCPTAVSPSCSAATFPKKGTNSGDSRTFKAEIGIFMFSSISEPFDSKWWFGEGKEWYAKELVLIFGEDVPLLAKKTINKWDRKSANAGQTDITTI